ncbi:MAG: chitobiase/beta-hexosaminidase C-terminal domain-containing protein [Eubacteriales bacterium]|nr:chitobiase/beta-hexosaminidase C-terminal domain-containing protein [Eubacteriales bacterium]
MKCPYCNSEVPSGTLYCPKCLTEVPWVKEFDTVEQQLLKKKLDDEKTFYEKEKASQATRLGRLRKQFRPVKQFLSRFGWSLLVGVSILIILGVTLYMNSYNSLYNRGTKAYQVGNYTKATDYLTSAINHRPDDYDANYLLAKVQQAAGRYEGAILVLKPMLRIYPNKGDLYLLTAECYYALGNYAKLQELFAECDNPDILELCADYICPPLEVNAAGGTYAQKQMVTFTSDYETIYYTLDGNEPTTESAIYSEPIPMEKGITILKAMGVNALGISSPILEEKYVISQGQPDAPNVFPKSGTYSENTMIQVEVPEGYRAYYAFDEVPTTASTLYKQPISMPSDSHVFYAILVSADGQVSEVTRREYYLEY